MSEQLLNVLYLRLEGPLQSWGDNSQWVIRDTRLEPTKSGVVGMLGCCLGLGSAPEHDRKMAMIGQSLRMGVRVDRQGTVVRDYHTVQGGVLSAEGKIKITQSTGEPETVVSERYYLSDACFLVALAGEAGLLAEIEAALRQPAWPPYLGRKSCVPSVPLYPALPDQPSRVDVPTLRSALESVPMLSQRDGVRRRRAVIELDRGEQTPNVPIQRRRDVPISFATRQFGFRYVYEVDVAAREEVLRCTYRAWRSL